jgi:TPR repeat protein
MTDAKDENAGFEAYRQGNYNRALELWKPLGELGNPEAQFWIGHLHYYGQGVTQDYSEAEKWYRLAAERGLTAAQVSLGNLFERGLGVSKDYVEAGEWYRRVAEQDEAAGQWALGNLYNDGLGVSQNFAEAAKWYRLAADQGFAPAQCCLGKLYETGRGVPGDSATAVELYKASADQDFVQAQVYLSFMYANGSGVVRDYVFAHKWISLALSKMKPGKAHDIALQNITNLERIMTPQQIANANRRASQWKPSGSLASVASSTLQEPIASNTITRALEKSASDRETASIKRNIMGVLGFIIAFALTFALEFLLFAGIEATSGRRMVPVGPGWIVGPFGVGVAGWHFSRGIDPKALIETMFKGLSSGASPRLPVAIYASWALSYISYLLATERHFSYWYRNNIGEFWLLLMLPPTVCTAVIFIFRWAAQEKGN